MQTERIPRERRVSVELKYAIIAIVVIAVVRRAARWPTRSRGVNDTVNEGVDSLAGLGSIGVFVIALDRERRRSSSRSRTRCRCSRPRSAARASSIDARPRRRLGPRRRDRRDRSPTRSPTRRRSRATRSPTAGWFRWIARNVDGRPRLTTFVIFLIAALAAPRRHDRHAAGARPLRHAVACRCRCSSASSSTTCCSRCSSTRSRRGRRTTCRSRRAPTSRSRSPSSSCCSSPTTPRRPGRGTRGAARRPRPPRVITAERPLLESPLMGRAVGSVVTAGATAPRISAHGTAVAGATIRVEELARRADVSVDTIRFYQKRQLLPPPRREGRIAWYGADHVERLGRIKELQRQGFSLAVIRRCSPASSTPPTCRSRPRSPARSTATPSCSTSTSSRRASGPRAAARGGRARGADRPAAARRRVGLHRRRRRRAARRAAAARGRLPAPRPPRARAPAPRRHPRDRRRRGRDVRRARAAPAPGSRRSPTTRRPSASSTRSARCCPPSPRSSRTTSAACCSRSRRSTSKRSATRPSSRPRAASPAGSARVVTRRCSDATARFPRATRSADAVEGMFDRLAPRYDRMNRVISLGLDRRGATHTVDELGLARPGRSSSTSRAAPATSAATSRRAATARSASTSPPGCSRAAHVDAPLVRADGAAAPAPRRQLRRRHLRLRAAQLRRPRRRCSRECARVLRRGGRFAAARRHRAHEPAPARGQRGLVPRRGAAARARARARRRGVPLPPEVAPRTCRRAAELADRARAQPASRDVAPPHAHRRFGAVLTGTRA